MNHPRSMLRWLLTVGALVVVVSLAPSWSAAAGTSASGSLLQRLLGPTTVELAIQTEPERILPGWNPHHTCILTNTHTVPLIDLEVIAPVPDGLCLPRNGERATVDGEYDADRDAMVWHVDSLQPGESLVAHVVWHSYSTVAHGQQIIAHFQYRADGFGGGQDAPPVIVDRAKEQDPDAPGAYPTLTLTPSPTPSPTPAAILGLSPVQLALERGQRQVITCTLDSVESLYGIDIELTYDPQTITIYDGELGRAGTQVAAGSAPYPDFVVRNQVDAEKGSVRYVVTQMAPREPFSGSGVVMKFLVAHDKSATGDTTITWSHSELATRDGALIQHRIGQPLTIELRDTIYQGTYPVYPPRSPTPVTAMPSPTPVSVTGPAQVSIVPSEDSLEIGQEIVVSVVISQVYELYGADIRFGFDTSLLEPLDVDPSVSGIQVIPGIAPSPDLVVFNDVVEGGARYVVSQLNPQPPFTGDGLAFAMRARARASGECALAFTNCQLVDRWGSPIAYEEHTATVVIE